MENEMTAINIALASVAVLLLLSHIYTICILRGLRLLANNSIRPWTPSCSSHPADAVLALEACKTLPGYLDNEIGRLQKALEYWEKVEAKLPDSYKWTIEELVPSIVGRFVPSERRLPSQLISQDMKLFQALRDKYQGGENATVLDGRGASAL